MKKTSLLLILLFIGIGKFQSQIELVKDLPFGYSPLYNSKNELMYISPISNIYYKLTGNDYSYNNLNKVQLFNSNHVFVKNIKMPIIPFDTSKMELIRISLSSFNDERADNLNFKALYATSHFFNSDDKLEFIVSYMFRETNSKITNRLICVFNEDGVLIKTFTGYRLELISNSGEFKNANDDPLISDSVFKASPGILPCFTCSSKVASINEVSEPQPKLLDVNSFPNPTNGIVTLSYTLPLGVNDGTIYFYSQQGEKLKEFKVHKEVNQIGFNTEPYAAGIYYYELFANGLSSGGKKMVVIK